MTASDLALERAGVLRIVEIEAPVERSIVELAVGLGASPWAPDGTTAPTDGLA